MLNADLLADIKGMLEEALERGIPYREFEKQLAPLLVKRGWWGIQTLPDPLSGEAKPVQLGSEARIRTIYKTNMRTARAAGQWERVERTKAIMPYLLYQLGPSAEHRAEHVSWKGILLPVNDPFWDSHMTPNGWGCKCWVRQVSKFEGEELMKQNKVSTSAPPLKTKRWENTRTGEIETLPVGIDPGWNYNPGKNRQAHYSSELTKKESILSKTLSKPL